MHTAQSLVLMEIQKNLTPEELDRIIEMAWEDRTTFDAITAQFGLSEKEVITLMRREMKESSFKMWRKRVQGRITKHKAKAPKDLDRFKSKMQKGISLNKISKR
jgi:uncharacterized protein (TIGR03643 family)